MRRGNNTTRVVPIQNGTNETNDQTYAMHRVLQRSNIAIEIERIASVAVLSGLGECPEHD